MKKIIVLVLIAIFTTSCKEPQDHTYRVITNNNDTLFVKANKWNYDGWGHGIYFHSENGKQYIEGVKHIILEK